MSLPKVLIIAGLTLLALGAAVWLFPKVPGLDRLGKLPGDIHIEKDGFRFYFPWVTCLIVSLLAGLIIKLFR